MPLIWGIIDDETKVILCNFQWEHYRTLLDLFVESQNKVTVTVPNIEPPEEIDKLMRQTRKDF